AWRRMEDRRRRSCPLPPRDCDLAQLPEDIEEMVAHLVHGVNGHPSQRALGRVWVAVGDGPLPLLWAEAKEHVGEQTRRVRELTHDVNRVLAGVTVMFDSLVPAHGFERGSVGAASGEHPLPL